MKALHWLKVGVVGCFCRSHAGAKSSSPSLDSHSDGIKYSEGDIGSDLKLDSRGFEENSDGYYKHFILFSRVSSIHYSPASLFPLIL